MRNRLRPLLMVVSALVVIAVVSVMALSVSRPSHPSAAGILTPVTPVTPLVVTSGVSAPINYESVGGCVEDAHDHNHDVDPRGFVDQEDDECLPAQSAHRQPDGALAN